MSSLDEPLSAANAASAASSVQAHASGAVRPRYGDGPPAGWSAAIKTSAVRTEVDTLTAGGSKIDHAGLLRVIDAALGAVAVGETVGQNIVDDLKVIAAQSASVFSSRDLNGAETGYLGYVFGQMVNGSTANAVFTGGAGTTTALGNLSAASVHSLHLQGGPMCRDEVLLFEGLPYAVEAVALRRWDDLAKRPRGRASTLAHYRPLLRGLVQGTGRLQRRALAGAAVS